MRYREHLRIEAPPTAAGTHNPVTHVFTPAAGPDVLYDGPADVQDGGAALDRNQQQRASVASDAIVFLADESAIGVLANAATERSALDAIVTWADGSQSQGRVETVSRFDGVVELVWLR